MRVSQSHHFLEAIANHPKVWPRLAMPGFERADFAAVWPECVGLEFDGGGFVFRKVTERVWNAHALFLPGHWHTRSCAAQAVSYARANGCTRLLTFMRTDAKAARRLAEDMGMRSTGNQTMAGVSFINYELDLK